jgi:hypothetical protein
MQVLQRSHHMTHSPSVQILGMSADSGRWYTMLQMAGCLLCGLADEGTLEDGCLDLAKLLDNKPPEIPTWEVVH